MKNKRNKTYLGIAVLIFSVEVIIAMTISTGFIRDTFGDYLAAIFIYCCIRYITSLSINNVALLTLFIAFGIEFLQLTPLLETLNLENDKLVKTVFGSTFSIFDLIAYSIAILTVLALEKTSL